MQCQSCADILYQGFKTSCFAQHKGGSKIGAKYETKRSLPDELVMNIRQWQYNKPVIPNQTATVQRPLEEIVFCNLI